MIGLNGQAVTIEYPGAIYHVLSRGTGAKQSSGMTLTGKPLKLI
jgi:hypothetical protein